jgi:chromosome segregation ATPase
VPQKKIPTTKPAQTVDQLTSALKEGAYVAVGLAVLGFQRAQVRRVELGKKLEATLSGLPEDASAQLRPLVSSLKDQLQTLKSQLEELSRSVEALIAPALSQIKRAPAPDPEALARLKELSEQVKTARSLVESQLAALNGQLADVLKALDERVSPARAQLDAQITKLESRLPDPARTLVRSMRSAAADGEEAMRSAVGLS